MTDPVVTPGLDAPVAYVPDGGMPRRGFGITTLVLGILLVLGVLLWFVVGATLFYALIWIFPLVVTAAFVIAAVHLLVALGY